MEFRIQKEVAWHPKLKNKQHKTKKHIAICSRSQRSQTPASYAFLNTMI